MKIAKPNDVMLLLGRQSTAGQPHLTITIGYACHIDNGARLSEQQAWAWLAPLFDSEPFDVAEKKRRGGYAVAGSACAPAGQTATGLMVRVGVGELHKSVAVHGDRRWQGGVARWSATDPEPFERMPIGLSRAYGASNCSSNPYGIGCFSNPDEAEGAPLPNVEHPEHLVLAPSDTPPLATLGPLPQGSPERMQWLGTLDKTWQSERHPWLPDDTDPRWFDRLPADQCQDTYWRGDEAWFAENMHPQRTVMCGKLPGLRPRLLVRDDINPEQRREVPLDLDTVWLFPTDERVVVLYRAAMPTRREDAQDILGLAVFTEHQQDDPHSTEHWAKAWQVQDDHKVATMNASAPVVAAASSGLQPGFQDDNAGATAFNQSVRQTIADAKTKLVAEAEQLSNTYGLTAKPANIGVSEGHASTFATDQIGWPTQPAALGPAIRAHIGKQTAQAEAEMRAIYRAHGLNYDRILARPRDQPNVNQANTTQMMAALTTQPWAIATSRALQEQYQTFEKDIAAIQAKADELRKQAATIPETQAGAAPSAGNESFPAKGRLPLDKAALLNRYAAGLSCAWVLLEDVDLSDTSLQGIDLSHAVLNRCVLQRTNLESAVFQAAELQQCDFRDAKLNQTSFCRAQMADSTLDSVSAHDADFTQARLTQTSFVKAALNRTCWVEAQATACNFEHALMPHSRAMHVRFSACRLTALNADQSSFNWATFERCTLVGASLAKTTMEKATLLACEATSARFTESSLQGLRVLKGTNLNRATLEKAQLSRASLQDSTLVQAILCEANMDGCLIKNCDLTGSNAWHLVARSANFTGSRITQASWRGANLMHTRWSEAIWQDADLTGSNLHAADTRRVRAQGVQLKQALMTRCRLIEDYAHE